MRKSIVASHGPVSQHWVGDGFPVRTAFSCSADAERRSPFLMLDYAGPADFPPSDRQRGVGAHPHKGFETVTIVYQGEVEHRDSTGAGGLIGPGDVQWMTAAGGIVHEEKHSEAFTRAGGTLEMAQLWVNLPAANKRTPARYQTLSDREIPRVSLDDRGSVARIITGSLEQQQGPAQTFSPLLVLDLELAAGADLALPVPDGFQALVVPLAGRIDINGEPGPEAAGVCMLSAEGSRIELATQQRVRLLVLAGEPLNEPVAAHGPFVMNTTAEIHEAIADFRAGRFGEL